MSERAINPTHRQRRVVDKLVENGGSISKAMRDVGYSPNTAKTPQKLTESLGFKQLMAESGLTEKLIADALTEDIKAKPQNRIGELNLGAKILKMTDENKIDNFTPVQIIINIADNETRDEASNSTQ